MVGISTEATTDHAHWAIHASVFLTVTCTGCQICFLEGGLSELSVYGAAILDSRQQ